LPRAMSWTSPSVSSSARPLLPSSARWSIIGLILGGINFSDMFIDLSGTNPASLAAAKDSGAAVFAYGSFITAIINFLIIAFVVFMLVKAMNSMMPKKAPPAAPPAGPTELDVLKEILVAVKK